MTRVKISRRKPPRGAPVGTYFNQEAADHAINFIQALKHTKGKWAGKPFILLPWQLTIITEVFGWLKADGYRLYNTVYIEIPKKNGKSELAAAVALYLLFADREPGAEIYGAAVDRDQAAIVFQVAAQMVRMSPALMKRCKIIDSIKRIVVYETSSFYRVLSKEVKAKHGFNTHGVVFDELHAQSNRELFDVLTKGAGDARRQPLFFLITTAGIDRKSICWEQHEKARQILNGIVDDPTFYPVIYGPPDDEGEDWDWESEANWWKVNPSLGEIIDIEKVRDAYREAKRNIAEENIFKQLRLNIWVKQSLRWMRMADWDKCGQKPIDPESLRGQGCYAGLDLSSSIDLTALGLVFPELIGEEEDTETGELVPQYRYRVLMDFWVPEEMVAEKERRGEAPYEKWVKQKLIHATPGNVIDYGYILRTLENYRKMFDIRELAFDRWGSQRIMMDLQELGFEIDPKLPGPHLVEFGQGVKSMSPPTKDLMTLVLQGRIEHGGHPVLRWNADNMVVTQDAAGNIKPDKAKATQKIDGMVAMIMALDRAVRHQGEGKSIYEEHGLTTV